MHNKWGKTIVQKRKKKKQSEKVIIFGISILLIAGIAVSGAFLVWNILKRNQMTAQMKEQKTTTVYRVKETIERGQVINLELLEAIEITPAMDSGYYAAGSLEGKIASVTIPNGMILLSNMIRTEEFTQNQREIECDVISLNNNLVENDYVDVRLMLPNGEDYIVLSKKSVHGITCAEGEPIMRCYLWMEEEEILYYSAALVDAYLYAGATLYTAKYIEPLIQEASYVTYLPSLSTLELIRQDPNLVETARQALKENQRKSLENRLASYLNQNVREISWNPMDEETAISPEDTKLEDTKSEDTELEDTKFEDTEPEDTKPEDTKPEDTYPEEANPDDFFLSYEEDDKLKEEEP